MATQEIVITPHPLPDGFCFTTYQDLLDTFSAHQTADLPVSGTQIFVSEVATPSDLGKVWLKLDGAGHPINFFWFSIASGSWEEVDPPNTFWGIGGNTSNDYTVSVSHPPVALVTGQIFFFKITATNTGAATLKINAFATAPFQSAGAAMPVGGLKIGTIVGAVWTGTTFELLGGARGNSISELIPGTDRQVIKTVSGVTAWATLGVTVIMDPIITTATGSSVISAHGLGGVPDIASWFLEAKAANNGYAQSDRIPLESLTYVQSSQVFSIYTPQIDATNAYVGINNPSSGMLLPSKSSPTGAVVDITATIVANWRIVGKLIRF